MKIILIPGMGCTPVATSNWYAWCADAVRERYSSNDNLNSVVDMVLRDFCDPHQCREDRWIPFVRDELMNDTPPEDTILIGHSSGAACTMRLLEAQGKAVLKNSASAATTDADATTSTVARPFRAGILVAAAHTDLGDAAERRSGYFNRPWEWPALARGAEHIVLFHGTDDPLIPVAEARFIAEQLQREEQETPKRKSDDESAAVPATMDYRERDGQSHFFRPWAELLDVLDELILLGDGK